MRTSCIAQGTLLSALWWPKREEIKKNQKTKNKKQVMCIHIDDSLYCTIETNTTL